MKKLLLICLLTASCIVTAHADDLLAFPGAQGWGRYATGGRSGSVYHVTNLNDSGTGSLRDAVSSPNRIIVFDVSGVINISSRIVFENNLYVAGQTAPGEGIIVYGDGVSFSGADNIIVRYIRFRMGKNGTSGKDCAGVANGANMIFDHCSFSWGLDEVFSINPDGKGTTPENITLSYCIFGQGLLSHSAGGLMQSDSITLYRNFYCDNSTRNNKVKGAVQYVNNIVYNWKNGCFLMGGDSSGSSYVNLTNNMFINGPSGTGNAITSGNSDFHLYAEDNWQDRDQDGVYDPYEIPQSEYTGGPTFMDEPYSYPDLDTWEANELIDSLLPEVGATLPYRDFADFYMYYQCLSFGTEGALISTEDQLPFGAPDEWDVQSFTAPTDSDGDGMPDEWEDANGTDAASDDAMDIAANGYTNIENYINSLTKENRTQYLRVPMMIEATEADPEYIVIGWSDYTEGEEGFYIEQLIDGAYEVVGTAEANAQEYKVEGLTAGTAYSFRVRAFAGDVYSDYAELDAKTNPEEVEMVDCDTFVGDDNNWLIEAEAGETVTEAVLEVVEYEAIVVRGEGDVVISGDGTITGEGSFNKAGSGTLTLDMDDNDYTGQTVLHGGTFSFSSLKDGGENSSIGASYEYSQNWIWDGGIWNYTGSSTSTNRNAMVYDDTEFCVENDVTVDMTGYIEGTGNVTFSGAGTIRPADDSFFAYDGNTILKDGATLTFTTDYNNAVTDKQLYLSADDDATKTLVLAGGTFINKSASDAYPSIMFPIEVQDDTYSYFQLSNNTYWKSDVSGTGTMEYTINWVREYISGDWSNFYGTLVANGTGTTSNGSQLLFQSGFDGMPNTKVYLKGNTRIVCWATNDEQYIGGLSGESGTYLSGSSKQTSNAQMIWHIGGMNTDEEFNGVIDNRCSSSGYNGTVTIYKEGSGDWRLTGTNIYSGKTYVEGGSLIVNGSNTGTGAVTVEANGTLAGTGSIAGAVTVNEDGYIQGGDTLIDGSSLTLTSTLKVASGGTVKVLADRSKCNTIAVSSTITLSDGAILEFNEGLFDEAPYDATEFQIFDASSTISGEFETIYPTTPGDGQTWDTSDLYTSGILRVVGGDAAPEGDDEEEEEDDDDTDSGSYEALIAWGTVTAGTYDSSSYNNKITGVEGTSAEGFEVWLTGNAEKSYSSSGTKIYVTYEGETTSVTAIKISNGAQNTVYLPDDAVATKVTFYSFINKTESAGTDRDNYWAEVAGNTYDVDESVALTCFSDGDMTNPDVVAFDLDNITESFTFTNAGYQPCIVLDIEYYIGDETGIASVSSAVEPLNVEYYNLSGMKIDNPTKGLYIMRQTNADGSVTATKVIF